ncbi:MAG TPA: phosphomannomutase/phosphoglucomutase, partial [Thiobacillaceae bacterium]
EQLQKQGGFGDGSVSTIDGVRVDYPDSWGLARASNTTSTLVFRFEGRTEQDLQAVRQRFQEQLEKVAPGLAIPN